MKNIDKHYKLIPMSQITDEAREIAVRWVENLQDAGGIMIEQKHKLASDIMNYAKKYTASIKSVSKMKPIEYLKSIYGEKEFDHINITLNRIAELIDDYNRLVLPQANTDRDMWKMLDQINVIMWESYMIKGRPFGRDEGLKIMKVLEQWAERH